MSLAPGTYAIFQTSEGKIVCKLHEKDAPKTVANFIELAEGTREWTHPTNNKKSKDKLFNGTIFHRVIPKFMIQGGDPAGTGFGGPGYKFEDEQKVRHTASLSQANWRWQIPGRNSNGSQFFITVAATPWLTGNHTIFGDVVEGQDIVDKISEVDRDRGTDNRALRSSSNRSKLSASRSQAGLDDCATQIP